MENEERRDARFFFLRQSLKLPGKKERNKRSFESLILKLKIESLFVWRDRREKKRRETDREGSAMGQAFRKLFDSFFGNKDVRVISLLSFDLVNFQYFSSGHLFSLVSELGFILFLE